MYIANFATREAVGYKFHSFYPAVIKQHVAFHITVYRLNCFLELFIGFWIMETDLGELTNFMVK